MVRDVCTCCQPRIDPGVRVRRRSSHVRTGRQSADGMGGGWNSSGQWIPPGESGLGEPQWHQQPGSDEDSSDESASDANSSVIERMTKAVKRRGKAKRREKRRLHQERRAAAVAAADGLHAPINSGGGGDGGSRARRQSAAVFQESAASRARRRASAPDNVARARRGSLGSLEASLEVSPPGKGSGKVKKIKKSDSHPGLAAVASGGDAKVPAWRVGAVDVLNKQGGLPPTAPKRERRKSKGRIQSQRSV